MPHLNEITQDKIDDLCDIFNREIEIDDRYYKLDILLGENNLNIENDRSNKNCYK